MKDGFIDAFQIWLSKVEKESNKSLKVLYTDSSGELILAKLKNICDWKDIIIKYIVPYMHKKNGLADQGSKTIVIIKDSLLINSGLLLKFWAKAMDTANYF